jgi:hypothetical protein
MINQFLHSIFQGYKESEEVQQRKHEQRYDELTHYPMLFSSNYLFQLTHEAESVEDVTRILDYLRTFGHYTHDVESYQKVYKGCMKKGNQLRKDGL